MADDSWDVPTFMEFKSTLPAIGMKDYVLDDITPSQQSQLNELLITQKREDEEYLASHPEIRGIIALILRLVMKHRPKCNVHHFIAQYFTKPSGEIREEIHTYLTERSQIISKNSFIMRRVKESPQLEDTTSAPLLESEQVPPSTEQPSEPAEIKDSPETKEVEVEETFTEVKKTYTVSDEDVFSHLDRYDYEVSELICLEVIEGILDEIFGENTSGGHLKFGYSYHHDAGSNDYDADTDADADIADPYEVD